MNGDLISREALKKALEEYKYCGFYDKVIEIIDNTPTVDIKDEIAGAYNEGYACGGRESKRPQGEWVYGEDECGQDGWFCSECGFFVPWYYQYYEKDIDFIRDYKVCPHCLAEMVTYTGKDRDTKGGAE